MPKIGKLRQHKIKHNPYGTGEEEKDDGLSVANPGADALLSKGQKRRLLRKNHVMQKLGLKSKEEILASLKKKQNKAGTKEKTNSMFSSLEATLKPLESTSDGDEPIRPAAGCTVKSNKMKKSIAVRETARMKLVQQHPSFQENPISAINQHLQQMLKNRDLKSTQ